MKNKLIIIDGPSTVGKSSIAKQIYEQINQYEATYWLHEECVDHPIRDGEFLIGDLHTSEGMALNRDHMLQRWKAFRDHILIGDKVCIVEGCFLHSIDRYLIESIWDEEEIQAYFSLIEEILRPLNPLIVFLYRPDMKLSYHKAFKSRGDWWRKLILKVPEPIGYFKDREYTGDESIYKLLQYEQEVMTSVFERLNSEKIKIDTSNENWHKFAVLIMEKVGYIFEEIDLKCPPSNLYCGEYYAEDINRKWFIHYDEKNDLIYSTLFWSYMPMKYVGNNMFEMISFPIYMKFNHSNGRTSFQVSGNYDWDLNNKLFVKNKADVLE